MKLGERVVGDTNRNWKEVVVDEYDQYTEYMYESL